MSEFSQEVIQAARTRVGTPFRHHYEPENVCMGGSVTVDTCMEAGLDIRGFDCSGLLIASVCDVVGIATQSWPRDLRHSRQMAGLISLGSQDGELAFLIGAENLINGQLHTSSRSIHMGIAVGSGIYIHADGNSKAVRESPFTSGGKQLHSLSYATLLTAAGIRL